MKIYGGLISLKVDHSPTKFRTTFNSFHQIKNFQTMWLDAFGFEIQGGNIYNIFEVGRPRINV